MINKNLSKISEFGIWLIQWFGDFSKDIKVLQIRTLNSIIQFLVAPQKLIYFPLEISIFQGEFVLSPLLRKLSQILQHN